MIEHVGGPPLFTRLRHAKRLGSPEGGSRRRGCLGTQRDRRHDPGRSSLASTPASSWRSTRKETSCEWCGRD